MSKDSNQQPEPIEKFVKIDLPNQDNAHILNSLNNSTTSKQCNLKEKKEIQEKNKMIEVENKKLKCYDSYPYSAGLYGMIRDLSCSEAFKKENPLYTKYKKLRGTITVIEGTIAVGKTSMGCGIKGFLDNISLPCRFLEESVVASMRDAFYADQKNLAFPFQIQMLSLCQLVYEKAKAHAMQNEVVIIDRSVWGNAVFACLHREFGNISDAQFTIYKDTLKQGGPYICDQVVYLDVSPEKAKERIKKRSIESEQSISLEYLDNLDRAYTLLILSQVQNRSANIIPVPWDSFRDIEYVLDLICDSMDGKVQYNVSGNLEKVLEVDSKQRRDIMSKLFEEKSLCIA